VSWGTQVKLPDGFQVRLRSSGMLVRRIGTSIYAGSVDLFLCSTVYHLAGRFPYTRNRTRNDDAYNYTSFQLSAQMIMRVGSLLSEGM
jgi:hypothetical protein